MARRILCRVTSRDPLSWCEVEPDDQPLLDGDVFVSRDDATGALHTIGRVMGGGFGFLADGRDDWRGWSVQGDDDAAQNPPSWAKELQAAIDRLARTPLPGGVPTTTDWIDDVLAGLPRLASPKAVARALDVSRRHVMRAIHAGLIDKTVDVSVRGERERKRLRIPRLALRRFLKLAEQSSRHDRPARSRRCSNP